MSPVPCGLSPVDTILVLKFEWGQRGQAVLRFEWKSGWDQTGKLELASTLTFGFVNPAGTEPYFRILASTAGPFRGVLKKVPLTRGIQKL